MRGVLGVQREETGLGIISKFDFRENIKFWR